MQFNGRINAPLRYVRLGRVALPPRRTAARGHDTPTARRSREATATTAKTATANNNSNNIQNTTARTAAAMTAEPAEDAPMPWTTSSVSTDVPRELVSARKKCRGKAAHRNNDGLDAPTANDQQTKDVGGGQTMSRQKRKGLSTGSSGEEKIRRRIAGESSVKLKFWGC